MEDVATSGLMPTSRQQSSIETAMPPHAHIVNVKF